jgi:hypothetical protein
VTQIDNLPHGVLRLSALALCVGEALRGYSYFFAKRQEAMELSERNINRKATRH